MSQRLKPLSRKKNQVWNIGPLGLSMTCLAASLGFRLGAEALKPPSTFNAAAPESVSADNPKTLLENALEIVSRREDDLRVKDANLSDREANLLDLEKKIERQIRSLQAAEDSLRTNIGRARSANQEDISLISEMYQSMKPAAAAEVFEIMQADLAAGILSEMRPLSAAQIIAKLSPEKSYAISVILSGRSTSNDLPSPRSRTGK